MDIDTLGQTHSIAQQRTLLQAADYGQAFCMFPFTSDQNCAIVKLMYGCIQCLACQNESGEMCNGKKVHVGDSMIEMPKLLKVGTAVHQFEGHYFAQHPAAKAYKTSLDHILIDLSFRSLT
jgi:hypothetical protein